MRIGVDIMGGDFFPEAPIEGAISVLKKNGGRITPVLIGDENIIRAEILRQGADPAAFEIIHTPEYIGMGESPAKAITQKPNSTINTGIRLVKEGNIAGFVSPGNTGAMLVAASIGLGTIPGVLRPTIGVLFSYKPGRLSLLIDIGANIDVKPEYLAQFGLLGSLFMTEVLHIPNPAVALLNVGEEKGKGTPAVKEAYDLLENIPGLNFKGNAEGRDLYQGIADVYVCDGFTGNIILKFAESLYEILKERFGNDPFIETFNFENYGGVPILGVNGVVVIGHGISSGKAIGNMIMRAAEAAESGLTEKIRSAFSTV